MSTKTMLLTANDTWPTALTLSDGDITGFTVAMEIAYTPTPLVKTAVITAPLDGVCELRWTAGDLIVGEWEAKITITNGAGHKISTEFLTLSIDRDITP